MAADTSVKVFKSTDAGAPSLSGTAGALIAVLDACLVNGYNLLTATSVSVAGGVATVSFASAHGFEAGRVVLVAGATPAGLNGERRIISATTNSLTFDAAGIADGAASGTITCKMAAAGWAKPFSGTNLAAYKPTDVAARTQYIRVDDSTTLDAKVLGYEAMTDVNTGTRPIPQAAVAACNFWPKANSTTGTRPWLIVSDGKTFYYWSASHVSYADGGYLVWSGDLKPRRSTDAYAWGISGDIVAVADALLPSGSMGYFFGNPRDAVTGLFLARHYSGLGGSVQGSRAFALMPYSNTNIGSDQSNIVYPNGADSSLILTPLLCCQGGSLRGEFPGLYATPQAVMSGLRFGDKVEGVEGLAGRTVMALPTCIYPSKQLGAVFVDVTGPW